MQNQTHPDPHADGLLVNRIATLIGLSTAERPRQDDTVHQGPRQKVLPWQIMVGLIAHVLHFHGTFARRMEYLFGVHLSDSALSQRRRKLGLEPFQRIARQALRPCARAEEHPGCFFHGLRLLGIDGTQWSLLNTPPINAQVRKASSRRGLAAFAKAAMNVLVELGTHAPLGAALGFAGESELALAGQLWEFLPRHGLLILDRLYGQGPMLAQLQTQCAVRESHFLVRVRQKLATRVREVLSDGSAWVEVPLRDPAHPRRKARPLLVREIQGRVWHRREKCWVTVRLWTSLSPAEGSALELVALYARRWEQEVFYHELKLQVSGGDLLQSHTPETAAQELIALLVAGSLLAEERLAVAALAPAAEVRQAGAVRISLAMCHQHTVALWMTLQAAQGLLDEATQAELIVRVRQQIAWAALPPRRARSCERKVRQPVKKWPRMITPTSHSSPPQYEVIPIA